MFCEHVKKMNQMLELLNSVKTNNIISSPITNTFNSRDTHIYMYGQEQQNDRLRNVQTRV